MTYYLTDFVWSDRYTIFKLFYSVYIEKESIKTLQFYYLNYYLNLNTIYFYNTFISV